MDSDNQDNPVTSGMPRLQLMPVKGKASVSLEMPPGTLSMPCYATDSDSKHFQKHSSAEHFLRACYATDSDSKHFQKHSSAEHFLQKTLFGKLWGNLAIKSLFFSATGNSQQFVIRGFFATATLWLGLIVQKGKDNQSCWRVLKIPLLPADDSLSDTFRK